MFFFAVQRGVCVYACLLRSVPNIIFFRVIEMYCLSIFVAGLHCFARAPLVAASWGHSLVVVRGLLTAVISLVVEHEL